MTLTPAPGPVIVRWEYGYTSKIETTDLDKLGDKGWEIVGLVQLPGREAAYLMKRPRFELA